ncbi:glycoprotein 3-alpha-L-fucosyltransferase A [Leptopilina heterotoma]|uniref:glycoprotein 3-alpha-L-fucosyltransferase A n=1 Tax=Leptopilina heterotoma TaxID=63436 RepID=UPI001CA7E720|nr:glycoprotein 3-alpha-L-fucosyltransferase A [Leptopilina heterotoma]XP_043474597.1 glycoprotein 3-alpha-L-fucosyltransferase A [Leptopilina heterotoma]XP_043474598.1 glycoprotein 3-alpha-L-fucosyltransferase A [Leptopilina heterotoma]XP_043474600.1 glycoprotein 3-alpha-L-fucosyltransferase A [Leptopilina heterotoma]XP_043474601.1 glycoprotein 3-alpha-L-fucosyltransferase A [Leptopilina heterotoma]XP_043474602.1 glycoprotein 3-alpha-L-fucosyltransferase A [Leptopilina heterotoma]
MGLPRFSLKRCFLYVFCLTGMFVVIMNVRQKEIWHSTRADAGQLQAMRVVDGPQVMNTTVVQNAIEAIVDITDPSNRPWYMKGGKRRPQPALKNRQSGRRLARLWPDEDAKDDRITNQLMFVPPDYNRTSDLPYKKILIPHGMSDAKVGHDIFTQHGCPVNTCTIIRDNHADADLILFKDYVTHVGRRRLHQIWLLYFLECPYHTQTIKSVQVNWTATYRRDSDIVAPYERWQYFDSSVTQIDQNFNYAENKTKKVAWFVSNCHPRNQRMNYAKELSKHIQVDIYGACGNLRCPRSQSQACFDMLDADYKFYLAFENSNCRDYITEKFFVNGLGHNVLPIVMGAHPRDYAKSAPYRSYIHVDEFKSPKELAEYLHRLDNDDELYNSYFKWKGTGEFINTYFWCRVCAMLHDTRAPKYYKDLNEWWRGDNVCVVNSWRENDTSENDLKHG